MRYELQRGEQVSADLEGIYDFLFVSYVEFGEHLEDADAIAAERVVQIENAMEALADLPHQGTRHDAWIPGLRNVTKDRAVFYFTVDDEARVVRVLAVFFGSQDHQRAMLRRLRRKE
jgi:plasmid stabilization system protein ParE